MLNLLLQTARPARGHSVTSVFRHLGALGLFSLAILDSSPLPTFAGPDILTAILAASHRNPWYEYPAVATAGSAYLHSKFGAGRVSVFLKLFEKWGTGTLVASTAVPFPFPTSMVFAAAGASNYRQGKYLGIVAACRAVRYTAIAVVADMYGRPFIHMLRHPTQNWGWFLLFAAALLGLIAGGILVNRRLATATAA